MALINTDWTKELQQVESTLNKILDEKLEPMADRILEKGIAESSVILAKASFEVQEAIKQATKEIEHQRKMAIKELKHLIYFAGAAVFVLTLLAALLFVGLTKYVGF